MDETHTDPPPAGATNIPPAARHAANKRFIIPLDTRIIHLPDPSISLKQLADFTLPAVKAVLNGLSLDIAEIREIFHFLAIFSLVWKHVHGPE